MDSRMTSADHVYERKFSRSLNDSYKQPYEQYGAGIGRVLKKIESGVGKFGDFAKRNKLVSAVGTFADITGTRKALDGATGGTFTRAVEYGKQEGYGSMTKPVKKQSGSGKRKQSGKGKGKKSKK